MPDTPDPPPNDPSPEDLDEDYEPTEKTPYDRISRIQSKRFDLVCYFNDEVTTVKKTAIAGWETQDLGWRALRESAKPIGWPVYLIAVAVVLLVKLYEDSLQLADALKVAVAPLTVLLAIGSLPLLRKLVATGCRILGRVLNL